MKQICLLLTLSLPFFISAQALENIALGGTATASSTATSAAGYVPWKAVDGDLATRWLDNDGANPDYIQIVFEDGPHVIESYAFWMDDLKAVTAYTAELFDGETLVATDDVSSPTSENGSGYDKYSGSFASVSATSIKLTITTTDGRERLHELEVYAYSNEAPSDVTAVFDASDTANPFVDINWTDNTSDELGFTLSKTDENGTSTIDLDPNTTSYMDADVEYLKSYSYTVSVNLPGDRTVSGTAVGVAPFANPLNVSYNSTVTDYSSERNTSTQQAANAVDGMFDNNHRWLTADDADVPHHVTIALAEASTVASYFLYMNPNIWATALSIDYSTDGTNFTEILNNDSPEVTFLQKDGLNLSLISGNFDTPVDNVTHIRLNMQGVFGYNPEEALDLAANDPRMRVHEFEIYSEPLPEEATGLATSEDIEDLQNPTLTLTWDDNQNNETGFSVYNGITKIADLEPNETSYTLDLIYGINYELKVGVANVVGETISEAVGYNMADPLNNVISFQKPAISSSNYDITRDEDEAVDGDRNSVETSRWMTSNTNDPLTTPEWIEVDLGANYNISGYRLTIENHASGVPTAWEFQYDDDGSWVSADVAEITTTPSVSETFYDLGNGNEINAYTLTTTSVVAQKVRWYVTASPTLIRLYELEVFGSFIVDKTWDGASWSPGTPVAGDQVLINGPYNTSTSGDLLELNSIVVSSDGSLTIEEGDAVSCVGTFDNQGSVEVLSGGSLVTMGEIVGEDFTIHRTTPHSGLRYSVVGSPIAAATIGDLGSTVYSYDESVKYDQGVTDGLLRFVEETSPSTVLTPGIGYFSVATGSISFEGKPNTGEIIIPVTNTDNGESAYEGFNLVANPYPSSIEIDAFMDVNTSTSGTVWLWDDQGSDTGRRGNDDYITVNEVGVVSPNGGSYDKHIRSGQGFFVQLDNSGDITFNNDMRREDSNDAGGFFRKTETKQSLKITVSDENSYNETLIGFMPDATVGVDRGYDAAKWSTGALQIFTLIDDNRYAIQGLPTLKEATVIPLEVLAHVAGDYKIQMSDLANLEDGYKVYLEDAETGKIVSLMNERSLDIRLQEGANKKFNLILSPEAILDVDQSLSHTELFKVTSDALLVTLNEGWSKSDNVELSILSISGKVLLNDTFENKSSLSVPFDFQRNTIYILQVSADSKIESSKIILK
ncbi:MAG: discoidin domain-containing protein [Cyclobacteriaceae bacterium]